MSARSRLQVMTRFERWGFDSKGWSPTTRTKYMKRIHAADAWMQEHCNTPILWADAGVYREYLFSTTASARNRNNVRQALVAFGDYLVDIGWNESNPAASLPRLPEPSSVPKALNVDTARRIAVVVDVLDPLERALVLLLLYGGLRKNEARTLEWRNVSEDYRWLTVAGKGGKERTIPLHPDAGDALRTLRLHYPSAQWVFPSPRRQEQPISESYIKGVVYDVGDMVGLDHLHPHLFRHTVATRMLEQGASLRDVQEFLGHADPKTTAIYTRVRPARLQEAVSKLDFRGQGDAQVLDGSPDRRREGLPGSDHRLRSERAAS